MDVVETSEQKNATKLVCPKCSCTVFAPLKANLYKNPFQHTLKALKLSDLDNIPSHIYKVKDMMEFENIGFTLAKDGIKYLICADCEVGPLGWFDPKFPGEYCIAQDRVNLL